MIRRAEQLQQRSQFRQSSIEGPEQCRDPVERERSDIPVRSVMTRRQRDDKAGKEDTGRISKRGIERADGDRSPEHQGARGRDDEGAVCSPCSSASRSLTRCCGTRNRKPTRRPEHVKLGRQEVLEELDESVRERHRRPSCIHDLCARRLLE